MRNPVPLPRMPRLGPRPWLMLYLLAGLLVALKITYNQHGWLNTDSLLYLEQARLIAAGEFKAAAQLLSWILYPTLIAGTALVTGLELQTAAQLLNLGLFVGFVWGYHQLLLQLGARQETLHWGMLLLFSTPYMVGDVLGMLLRDEGFWTAFIWGLMFLVQFIKQPKWQHALLFQCCMAIATLFRVEGAVYLLLLPMLLWLPSLQIHTRFKHWLWLNSAMVCLLPLIGLAILTGHLSLAHLGRLQELYGIFISVLTQSVHLMHDKADIMGKQVLGGFLDDYATLSVWTSLLLIVLIKTLKVAGWPVVAVLLLGPKQWWHERPAYHRHLALMIIGVGLIISVFNILYVFVLSSRYVMTAGIVYLTLAPFAISDWRRPPHAYWQPLLAVVLLLMLTSNLIDRGQPDLDRLSVNYVRQINTQHLPVFYDTENARFYAKQPYLNRIEGYERFKQTVAAQQLKSYAIYVITLSADDQTYASEATHTLAQQGYQHLQTLYGWRKKTKALIYIKADSPYTRTQSQH